MEWLDKILMGAPAFFGALIGTIVNRDAGWVDSLITLAAGTATSMYVTPVAIAYFEFEDSAALQQGVAFLVGLLGLTIARKIINAEIAEIIKTILRK